VKRKFNIYTCHDSQFRNLRTYMQTCENFFLTWRQGKIIIKDSFSECRWSRWLVGVESSTLNIQYAAADNRRGVVLQSGCFVMAENL
jgi:hypothetical protein